MAKKQKPAAKPDKVVRLGRSAVTGKYVLQPAGKGGGSVSIERAREVMRTVLAQKKA